MEYVEITSVKEYLKEGVLNNVLHPFYATKNERVRARRGKIGEIIASFSREGNYSTTKTVLPGPNGQMDWVITNDLGQDTVLDDETFSADYTSTDVDGEYISKRKTKLIIKMDEPVAFKSMYGKSYKMLPGYYIVASSNGDFNELTPEDFTVNYAISDAVYNPKSDPILFDELL